MSDKEQGFTLEHQVVPSSLYALFASWSNVTAPNRVSLVVHITGVLPILPVSYVGLYLCFYKPYRVPIVSFDKLILWAV